MSTAGTTPGWVGLVRLAGVIGIMYVAVFVVPRSELTLLWSIVFDGLAVLLGILAITIPLPIGPRPKED
jgi:hypothetical protein